MKAPRITLSQVAVLVAVIAVNLAVGRSYRIAHQALQFAAITGPVLEFGAYKFSRSRGEGRMLWLGFVAGGSMALTSLFWTYRTPPYPSGSSCPWVRWAVWRAWEAVSTGLTFFLVRMEGGVYGFVLPKEGVLAELVLFLLTALPQLVIALSFGLLTRRLARRFNP